MRRPFVLTLGTMVAVASLVNVAGAQNSGRTTYVARLTPGAEVQTPPVESNAKGKATLILARDRRRMDVEIKLERIENVFAAHLHLGAVGENGGVVVTLFGPADPTGRLNGKTLCRTISKGNLEGELAGQEFEALIDAIDAGNIYVNVHTTDNDPETGPAAGDYPAGEVRGQVEPR